MTHPDFIEFLQMRRSSKLATLQDPGPSRAEIETILTVASRVPDHGKYEPWYFIVFEGEAREKAGQILRMAYAGENPDASDAKLDLEAERFMRAPLVIAVVSRIKHGKHPQWEQILSAGAACLNLCLSANALGYGSNWLSEWYSYSPAVMKALGLDNRDHIAGFIYIGTASERQEERKRPDLSRISTWWDGMRPLAKGDKPEDTSQSLPRPGFILPE